MNEIAVSGGPRALALKDEELIPTLRAALYPGASDESIKLVIGWCRASGKDPMKKPVHIVPMNVKKLGGTQWEKEWRDVVMPGIVDYRIDAARTGEHAGNEDPVFGPDTTMKLGGVDVTFPEWCEFTVLRMVKGDARRFTSGKVRWLETYAVAKADTIAPNAMWKKRPYGQLEKCAEALALRRGFPEVGAAPTVEEMVGRHTYDLDESGEVIPAADPPAAATVQRRSAKAGAAATPAAPSPAPAPADDVTDVVPKGETAAATPAAAPAQTTTTAPASAPAATGAPAAAPAAGTEELVGVGEIAWLKAKSGSVGADLPALLADMGGLVLEKLTKGDFQKLKTTLLAM